MQKTAYVGVMIAFSMLLSYVESLIPFYFGAPGIKLGLANLGMLLVLYIYGRKEAFIVNILRILLTGFLFGSMLTIAYSLSGGICSFLVMSLLYKHKAFSMVGVSVAGAVFHNIGQFVTAWILLGSSAILYYLPILLLAGMITGFVIGFAGILVYDRIGGWLIAGQERRSE